MLSGVQALVAEWIPFGANQIVGLNERLGALDRCQGGFALLVAHSAPLSVVVASFSARCLGIRPRHFARESVDWQAVIAVYGSHKYTVRA